MTDKVSVLIPARKEPYIRETLKDLYDNAAGEIEVILVLDGHEPEYKIRNRKGLTVLRNERVMGMRPCINAAVEAATGKYIMKMDAHCTIGEGWDEILKADCADNWIVVPRRFWWDAPNWTMKLNKAGEAEHADYMTYIYPFLRPYRPRLTCRPDAVMAEQKINVMLDEDMGFQGSCWFMHREHFIKRLGGMSTQGYGTFSSEPEEIGLKTQLGPWKGAIMRNKNTWYAHWGKPQSHWRAKPEDAGRADDVERDQGWLYTWDYWWHNKWPERVHDFEWLVDKFWPLRTWPDNWRWLVTRYDRYDLSELWPTRQQH